MHTGQVKVDLVTFDAGGGHRSAANALRLVIERQGRPWDLDLVNLQEVLDPLDPFRRCTGLRLQDLYNLMLKKGWTLGSPQLLRGMHGVIRLYHRGQVGLLRDVWRERQPDLVVSLIPHFNRALRDSLPATPFATILTDLADYPPHMWIEPQEQYLVCGTERAVEQALDLGHARERVFATSGMILHPRFYEHTAADRRSARAKLGLDPDLPTGLVLFGGQGSAVMHTIVERLDGSPLELQLILICGHNDRLAHRLRSRLGRIPTFVEGFTTAIPHYMHLSDFLIGKPGPGSISEALAMGLPAIVSCNAWTLPQERYNAQWLQQRGLGLVVGSFRHIAAAAAAILQPGALALLRANAAGVHNRAVFEIPDILDALLRRECS